MAERKTISKKTRFEVFKRDSFTCQYCGLSAPGVILEIDHLEPVSKGGTNDMFNLITACFDCNRGKGKRKISENDTLKKQKEQLKEINLRREQLKMMLEWKNELDKFDNEQLQLVTDKFEELSEIKINDFAKNQLKKWIKSFGVVEILDCLEISFSQYYRSDEDIEKVFAYIPKIASMRKRQIQNPALKEINYCKAVLKNRLRYFDEKFYYQITKDLTLEDCKALKEVAFICSNWTEFKTMFYDNVRRF